MLLIHTKFIFVNLASILYCLELNAGRIKIKLAVLYASVLLNIFQEGKQNWHLYYVLFDKVWAVC